MYERKIDRTHRACLLLLLDQSGSMREPINGGFGASKSEALAGAVNSLLYELVVKCIKNHAEGPRDYYDVGVLGYGGDEIGSALGGELAGRDLVSIVDIANHPLRVEEATNAESDVDGDQPTVPRTVKSPVWVDPKAAGGTPMTAVMDRCGVVLAGWVQQHPDSFPPIVINVSDGAATDGDPRVWAERLTKLATDDGNLLLFNLNLTALPNDPVFFPSNADSLTSDYARTLFDMSSTLPAYMETLAASEGMPVTTGARGFVLNAGVKEVVRFLRIGTDTRHAMG